MKNNKFTKATSIVMSAVVAGMAMGNGACYAAQTKLDEAKKLVKRLTTSQIVTDGRDFVNKVSNRDVLFFTAGSCTVAAIALVAAYHGYPNGLEDLAKHIVEVNVEEGKKVKLLALHLKGYKFEEETADAFLLISADPREAVAAQAGNDGKAVPAMGPAKKAEVVDDEIMKGGEEEKAKACGEKKEEKADGEMLRENVVYKATTERAPKFKALMDAVPSMLGAESTAHGKLELVTIDASCLFGARRNTGVKEIDKEFANVLISDIEYLAQLSKRKLLGIFGFGSHASVNDEEVKKEEKEEKEVEQEKVVVKATLYAARKIEADKKKGDQVRVKVSQGEGAVEIDAILADDVEEEIDVNREVEVEFGVEPGEYNAEGKKVTFADGSAVIEKAELVKEKGAEN